MPDVVGSSLKLNFYKMCDDVAIPEWGTGDSACFDLYTYIVPDMLVTLFLEDKEKNQARRARVDSNGRPYVLIYPHERMLIPTGLIFDIPKGYSIRTHPRSSVSIKRGLTLVNCEGVIDEDYVEQLMLPIVNLTNIAQTIYSHERLCQAELVEVEQYKLMEIKERPQQKSDRIGGFGSTGSN